MSDTDRIRDKVRKASKKSQEQFRDKIRAMFLGAMIGDAMGMAVEGLTAKQILEVTNGMGVNDFLPNQGSPFPALNSFPAGMFTDDWQLTRALVRSLIKMGCYNDEDVAFEMVKEFSLSHSGWGDTTKRAMMELKLYLDSEGEEGRRPDMFSEFPKKSDKPVGIGNGVAMRISPIAAFVFLNWGRTINNTEVDFGMLESLVMKNGLATHPDPRASFAAYSIAAMLFTCLETGVPAKKDDCVNLFEKLAAGIGVIEDKNKNFRYSGDLLYSRFRRILDAEVCDNKVPVSKLSDVSGVSCHSLESIPFSLCVFLRHPTSFEVAVLEAVNAGGDTDTNASMVGALVGANVGMQGIPWKWRSPGCPLMYREAIDLADQFCDTFM